MHEITGDKSRADQVTGQVLLLEAVGIKELRIGPDAAESGIGGVAGEHIGSSESSGDGVRVAREGKCAACSTGDDVDQVVISASGPRRYGHVSIMDLAMETVVLKKMDDLRQHPLAERCKISTTIGTGSSKVEQDASLLGALGGRNPLQIERQCLIGSVHGVVEGHGEGAALDGVNGGAGEFAWHPSELVAICRSGMNCERRGLRGSSQQWYARDESLHCAGVGVGVGVGDEDVAWR
jgi:hypothetical protein